MNKLSFAGTLYGVPVYLTRINKKRARNLFNKGIEIYICPTNLNPVLFVNKPFKIEYSCGADFTQLVRNIEYFFCINNQTGYFASFYINTKKI
jgi:hypothetical protein